LNHIEKKNSARQQNNIHITFYVICVIVFTSKVSGIIRVRFPRRDNNDQ